MKISRFDNILAVSIISNFKVYIKSSRYFCKLLFLLYLLKTRSTYKGSFAGGYND